MKTTNEKLKLTLKEIEERNQELKEPYAERLFPLVRKEDKELFGL